MNQPLPPGIESALIEAGGCKHTPQPWLACDTCRRPVPPWVLSSTQRVVAWDWQGRLIEGQTVEKRDLISMDNVPKGRLAELSVATTSPRAPCVKVVVDPRKGEQIHHYTKQIVRVSMQGKGVEGMSVVVLEITPDPERPEHKVRLYVHPHALILSTQDMCF